MLAVHGSSKMVVHLLNPYKTVVSHLKRKTFIRGKINSIVSKVTSNPLPVIR